MSEHRRPGVASDPAVATRIGVVSEIGGGRMIGIGGLPHVDPDAAAAFSIGELDIATVPKLPRRSAAESLVAQAIGGLPGVGHDDHGSIVVDRDWRVGRHDLASLPPIDLAGDGFVGLRAFLELASAIGHDGKPVKWQFVGPVTLGVAFAEAGVPSSIAFEASNHIVRCAVGRMGAEIRAALPSSDQIVVIDEPALVDLMASTFPVAPDEAVDLISGAMAAADPDDLVGVHCCGPCDIATLLSSGPRLISMPVHDTVVDYAGYLARFLDDDGIIAWGVVPTDRPVGPSADRYWKALADLWCALVERGVDATRLRRQALISPTCGFSEHQVSVARRLTRLTGEVARKVKDQAAATRFALGA